MEQMRLSSDGELETLKAADWLVLRGAVAQDSLACAPSAVTSTSSLSSAVRSMKRSADL